MPLIRKDSRPPPIAMPAEGDDQTRLLREGAVADRWAAARSLGGSALGVSALAAALAVEQDARVREAIFTSLAAAGSTESCAALVASLRSNDAALRTGALDALGATPAARTIISGLLCDADPDVRLLSCEIARSLPADEAQRLLCNLLDTEAEPNVCAAAVEVLAELGDEQAAPCLQRCAERFSHEPFLMFAIRQARQRFERAGGDAND
jgi:HEAT repeat protein